MIRIIRISAVVLFIGLLILQLSKDVFVMSWYKYNVEQLTELYCINVNSPELMCNAKCYISNFLEKGDTNKDQLSVNMNTEIVQYIVNETLRLDLTISEVPKIDHTYFYNRIYFYDLMSSIDHPPKFI